MKRGRPPMQFCPAMEKAALDLHAQRVGLARAAGRVGVAAPTLARFWRERGLTPNGRCGNPNFKRRSP